MQLVKSSAAMSDGEIEFLGEVTKTQRRNRAGSSRGKLSDRLLAISREELKEVEEDPGIQSDSEPTEVEIFNQERLPTKAQVEAQRFQEPILKWVAVKPSDRVPSWSRDLLPEEEAEADCDPPPPARADISLLRYKQLLEKENIPTNTNNAVQAVLNRQMVLRGNFAEDEEVVVQEGDCIYRTRAILIRRSSAEQEREEEEEEVTVVESEGSSADGRRRGEGRQRGRSVSSSPGRDIPDWRGLETPGRREPRVSREDQDRSYRRDGRDRREREDRDRHGGRYQKYSRHERTDRDRGSHRRSMEDRNYSRLDRGERERGSSRHDNRRTPTRYDQPRVGRHSGFSSSRDFQEYKEWEKRRK